MAIVHKKLGNGFVIQPVSSCVDNEHYFANFKKNMEVRWRFMSGTVDDYTTSIDSIYSVTGVGDLRLSASFCDRNDNIIILSYSGSFEPPWFQDVFGTSLTSIGGKFYCKISSSNVPFNPDDIDLLIAGVVSLKDQNAVFSSRPDEDGYYIFMANYGETNISTGIGAVWDFAWLYLSCSNAGAIYNFKDAKFDFNMFLTDYGVSFFRQNDNQFQKFAHTNIVPKEIEDSLRNVSYYGWENSILLESTPEETVQTFALYDMAITEDGTMYLAGNIETSLSSGKEWVVLRSNDDGKSWFVIDRFQRYASGYASAAAIKTSGSCVYVSGHAYDGSIQNYLLRKSLDGSSGSFYDIDYLTGSSNCQGVFVNSSGSVWTCGQWGNDWLVRYSADGSSGSFSTVDSVDRAGGADLATKVVVDLNSNVVYVCGYQYYGSSDTRWVVRSASDGQNFGDIDTANSARSYDRPWDMVVGPDGAVYVCGEQGLTPYDWVVRRSPDGSSGSFSYVDYYSTGETCIAYDVIVDQNNGVYVCGSSKIDSKERWTVRYSPDGSSGSFVIVDSSEIYSDSVNRAHGFEVDSEGYIYVTGKSGNKAVLRKGKIKHNYDSLGPLCLAPSIGYVESELSGTVNQKFKLENISEFPHSSGIFQMPNILLGTKQYGRVGTSEDDLIQINHIGSVVYIMWPNQTADELVKGVGSFSAGQKAGKLTTNFDPGKFINVSEYEHLALFCYVDVVLSGTQDSVLVRVEKRPLTDNEFVVDQAVEYEISGSVVEAIYRDIVHRKDVDYGTIGEVNWNIDIPLSNVKEIRISARHKNGQSAEQNKNFVVWGRLIKSGET